jgi:hypothetical protein
MAYLIVTTVNSQGQLQANSRTKLQVEKARQKFR